MHHPRLPLDLTEFVGRDAELDRLSELVGPCRLVTLTGSPGTGKTRLARELVRRRSPDVAPSAWVELAPLQEPGLLVPAVATALRVPDDVRPGDVETLARIVGDRRLLLVLDNCEHLVEGVAEFARRLLGACPGLHILATSREALGMAGERAWLVPGLGLPESADAPEGSEAVRLFLARARDVVPDFEPTGRSLSAVAEICVRLDGIPLALELAAARIRHLAPEEILQRLDDVFRLLTSDLRTTIPRHRTLRAAIDWSYDLLGPDSRTLLTRLAVFRGGFTLGAAERVASGADGALSGDGVLEVLGRLVDRSLVVVRERQGMARYYLLEAVRQYALEQLKASGEEAEVRALHAAAYLAMVRETVPHLLRTGRKRWTDRLDVELGNLRAALEWSQTSDPALHVELAGALWWFWFSSQHWTEAGRWIHGALALDAATRPGPDRAHLLFAAGALAALQVRPDEARPALSEAITLARQMGDARLEAYATNYLGLTWAGEGSPRAMEYCRQAAEWFAAHDDLYGLRLAYLLQGSSALGTGALDEAEALNRQGVEVARRFGEPRELAISLQNLAVVLIVRGRIQEAEALVLEALRNSRRDVSYYFIATGLGYLGEIRVHQGRGEEGARLLGAAEGIRERVGARPFPMDRKRVEALLPGLEAGLGTEAFQAAWAAGRSDRPQSLLDELTRAPESSPAVSVEAPPPDPSPDPSGSPPPEPEGRRPLPGSLELAVRAMGAFQVTVDGEAVPADRWSYAKPRELLALLLLHPAGRTRDQVSDALWPGSPPARARNSFHVTVHHLRKALDRPDWIGMEGDRYRLDPRVRVDFDVRRFTAGARAALAQPTVPALRAALEGWTGELLEGDAVGRWVDPHREELDRLRLELSLALGELLEETSPGEAAALYRELAGREELNEEVHRRYMRTLVQAGDRVGALRHYERLVVLLENGLDADPEPETRALYRALRSGGEGAGGE